MSDRVKLVAEGLLEALHLHDGGAGPEDVGDALRKADLPFAAVRYELFAYGFNPDRVHCTLAEALEQRGPDHVWTEANTVQQTRLDKFVTGLRHLYVALSHPVEDQLGVPR